MTCRTTPPPATKDRDHLLLLLHFLLLLLLLFLLTTVAPLMEIDTTMITMGLTAMKLIHNTIIRKSLIACVTRRNGALPIKCKPTINPPLGNLRLPLTHKHPIRALLFLSVCTTNNTISTRMRIVTKNNLMSLRNHRQDRRQER